MSPVVWVIVIFNAFHQPIGTFDPTWPTYGGCELARATQAYATNFPNWTKCQPIGARPQTRYHRRG